MNSWAKLVGLRISSFLALFCILLMNQVNSQNDFIMMTLSSLLILLLLLLFFIIIIIIQSVNSCNDDLFNIHCIFEGDRVTPLKGHGQELELIIINIIF